MAFEAPSIVVASALRTSSGNSGLLNASAGSALNVWLRTTAKQGTLPTLDVSVEWSFEGIVWLNQANPDAFSQKSSATGLVNDDFKTFSIKVPYYRIKWVIGGSSTPGWTFQVSAWIGA